MHPDDPNTRTQINEARRSPVNTWNPVAYSARTSGIRTLASRLLGPLVLCMVSLMALAPAATAAPPVHGDRILVESDVFHPRVSEACGFPVRQQYEGWYRTSTFYDRDGEVRMATEQSIYRVTWSANGKTLDAGVAGPLRVVYNDDGTQTLYITNVIHRNAPGEGITSGEAGRTVLVLTFDEDGNVISEELVAESGLRLPLQGLCDYLAP